MSADILTTDVLQARLNLMPQIHDELEAQIKNNCKVKIVKISLILKKQQSF